MRAEVGRQPIHGFRLIRILIWCGMVCATVRERRTGHCNFSLVRSRFTRFCTKTQVLAPQQAATWHQPSHRFNMDTSALLPDSATPSRSSIVPAVPPCPSLPTDTSSMSMCHKAQRTDVLQTDHRRRALGECASPFTSAQCSRVIAGHAPTHAPCGLCAACPSAPNR